MKFRFFTILFFVAALLKAQVGPPQLRCISCNASGDLTLTWVIPPDPGGQFFSYDIYRSATLLGPYPSTPIATISNYTINTYTDVTANGNFQSKYYFIKTRYGATGTNTSTPSDTLRSIFLNLTNPNDGTASLIYSNIHTPKLASSSANFNIYRENPGPIWTNIKNTTALNYSDTITLCNVFYNYQIQLTDASGCVSSSNISGKNFKDLIPPKVPFLDSVSVNSGGQTNLGWQPSTSTDCIGYVIYFLNPQTQSWQNIDTVFGINATNYTSTLTATGTSIQHCVASIDSCGNISPLGTDHSSVNLKTTYEICSRTANLTWTPYTNMPLGVLQYKVYCSVNAGPYTFVGLTSDVNYTHTGLEPGKTYCYIVRVFNTPQTITSTSNRSCLIATAPVSSAFVYLQSVSVDLNQNVTVSLFCDTLKSCRGFSIYKSEDGINFNLSGFVPYNGKKFLMFTDVNVKTSEKNYFYKAVLLDSCGNARYTSNIGKTVLLHVKNDQDKLFNNNLSWDVYSGWPGGVAGYYVYRVVNDSVETTPKDFVPAGITTYTDNVEDIVEKSGKVGYIVTAIENFGNPYGLTATSSSNKAEAYVEGQVFVPNAFAPKGENQLWKPITQFVEKTDYKVTVLNRWGTVVFETTDENKGWNGSGMEDNTYVYILQYKNARGEFVELKGTITMIR